MVHIKDKYLCYLRKHTVEKSMKMNTSPIIPARAASDTSLVHIEDKYLEARTLPDLRKSICLGKSKN